MHGIIYIHTYATVLVSGIDPAYIILVLWCVILKTIHKGLHFILIGIMEFIIINFFPSCAGEPVETIVPWVFVAVLAALLIVTFVILILVICKHKTRQVC